MATIAELIIAAGVDPSGIRTGLDQGAGYLRQFGRTAQQEVEETLKAFPDMGYRTAVEVGAALLGGLEPQFQNIKARLREQLARGVISQETFEREGALAAQSFNAALLVGIEELRGGGLMRAGDELETELVGKLKDAGIQAGRAFENGMSSGASNSLAGMGRIRQGLTSLIAQYTGTIPVLDRITGQLATLGLGSSIALGAVAGIAAIAAAYHFATKEASALAEAQDKATAALKRYRDQQAAGVGGQDALDTQLARQKLAAMGDALATQNNRVLTFTPGSEGYIAAKKVADALRKDYDEQVSIVRSGEQHMVDIRQKAAEASVAAMVKNMAALIDANDASPGIRANAERLVSAYDQQIAALRGKADAASMDAMTNMIALRDQLDTALHPKQGKGGGHDRGPFADERDQIGEVTTAFEALHKAGLPVGDLYEKLDAALRLVNFQLDQQTDKASAASNALRAIRTDILATNFNADDPRLAHSAPIALDTSDDAFGKSVEATIQRVQLLRDSLGEMSGDTATAEGQLQRMLDGVNARIVEQGGALHASNALLEIQRQLYQEIADEQKAQGHELWTPEDAAEIARAIKSAMDALHSGTKDAKADFQEIATAVHGLVDSLAGLGVIGPGISQAATSALHAAESIKKMQEASASASGLDTIAALAGTVGVVGGVIGAIGGLASLFNQHDAILEANNSRLEALRAALDAPKGVAGQQNVADAIAQALATPGILEKHGGGVFDTVDLSTLEKVLAASGISMDEFLAALKEAGIEFNGTRASLVAFGEALRLSIQAAQRFSASVSDQTALEQLRLKVYGLSEPLDALKSTLMLLSKFSPSMTSEFGLDQIDTSTEEGRAKLKKALEAMYDKLAAGLLSPEELAMFGGAKEFAAWLASASDALDALEKSASAAAGAMLYVPTGYKLALDRFNAMDPAVPPQPMRPSGPLESTSGGGGVVSQLQSGSQSVTYNIGTIQVDARERTPDELFAAVLKAAQRRAQTTYGRSDLWASVQTR